MDERVRDHFEVRWPDAVLEAVRNRRRPPEFVFDAILVDEAQDFSPPFFDVLAELLAPAGGVMLAFDRAQRLYARADGIQGRLDMRYVKKLNGTRRLRLRHANIATTLGASRRLPTAKIELDEGVPALFSDDDAKWASVPDAAAALAVARDVLERWRAADGYRTDGTVVLVPSNPIGRALVTLLGEGDIETNHIFSMGPGEVDGRRRKLSFGPHDQRVKVATIHSFKGWEADDVVLVEPPSGGSQSAAAVYVALTRPKSRIVVVASTDPYQLRQHFDELLAEPDPAVVTRAEELIAQARAAEGRRRTPHLG
jgi:UvrD-like helicase C-terminal domain